MRGCLLRENRESRESPGVEELEWENPADKNLLVYVMTGGVLSQYKKKIRNQGANTGEGREGAIPYYCLTKIHGSRTTS
jgi:hypothetical protein